MDFVKDGAIISLLLTTSYLYHDGERAVVVVINDVLGMNEMILRESEDQQILSHASNIQSSGKTLLFLINDILDLSKIESGKGEEYDAYLEKGVSVKTDCGMRRSACGYCV